MTALLQIYPNYIFSTIFEKWIFFFYQLRKTGIQEPTENSLSSKSRAPRTTPPFQMNEMKNTEQDGIPADCSAIYNRGEHMSGIYTIRPSNSQAFDVYCEIKSGEFWLGLEKIYSIVKKSNYILQIELEDWKDNKHYIEYSFHLGNLETNYTLHLVEIAGNIPKSLPEHKDLMFSTWDHKAKGHFNCPEIYSGGWWWHDVCGENNLNGKYNKPRAKSKPEKRRGICWRSENGRLYSIKSTKMLIHPVDLESFE
ncbi:Angiopoietin-related protein 3 [Sciurus carolinensis]|uniref:Angiopoietin-related protein 3 n=1 Tax=Sciurus carolinensis TaxID=30640 RepID=A0AA41MDI7_SCICA|nr:Angiopoietin-related protein 3 [Sciurus carolinensis]